MINRLLFFLLSLTFVINATAQKQDSTYPIVVKFLSIGTGTPPDAPVRDFIASFKKKNKIRSISADRIGPIGREGEYYFAFSLAELKKKQKTAFTLGLKATTEKYKGRGHFECEEKMQVSLSRFSSRTTITKKVF